MRRTVIILLLLANAVVLFWNLPRDHPRAAPTAAPTPPGAPLEIALGPLPAQNRPGAPGATAPVKGLDRSPAAVTAPPAEAAAVQPAEPAQSAPAKPAVPAVAAAEAPSASAAPPAATGAADPLCLQTAWLPAQRIEVLANDPGLRADRRAGDWLRLHAPGRALWMVFAGPMAQKDILPLQAMLDGQGVKAQEVYTPWRFALQATAQRGLNLGYFGTEAAAQARRDQAVAAGAAQAAVVAIEAPQTQRLRARLKDPARVQALIAASDPRAPWQACAPGVTAASAPALNDAAFGDGEGVKTEAVSKRR